MQLQQASLLHGNGRLREAESLYTRFLKHNPRHAGALAALALIALQGGNPQRAVLLFAKAIKVRPDQASLHNNRGIALLQLGRLAEAEAGFRQALVLQSDYPDALKNLGNLLQDQRRPLEALTCFDQAIALDPAAADGHCYRGNALLDLDRHAEAIASFDAAIARQPGFAPAWYNRGNVHKSCNRIAPALADYDRALALQPDYADARWNKALLTLLAGDFQAGWPLYEARWHSVLRGQARQYPQPLWLGDADIAGNTLLVHAEQGAGDVIQFCRYLPLLAERGAQIMFSAPRELLPLLATLSGDVTLVGQGRLPDFDLHCPLLSLPLACGTTLTTIPAATPYLAAAEQRRAGWQDRLGGGDKPRIGLVWSGSPTHANDHNRSLPLSALAPLLELPCEFHSLQKQLRAGDVPLLEAGNLSHHGPALRDFADTAALIMQMDLVISVDTAVAHLAGALGKPVWVLLPFAPDFRWLLERSDSPWYPSATLFRQPGPGDWPAVLARVRQNLAAAFPTI